MTGFPCVSVVITTCGRPRMLTEAVRSVLGQEMAPSEVIIVDDGEKGEARTEVEGMSHGAMPMRVVNGPGKGPGAARNIGVRLARGPLVAFLDDDDTWMPEKVGHQVYWLARRPNLGVLGTKAIPARCSTSPPGRPRSNRAGPRLLSPRSLARANRLVLSSVMARRTCLAEAGEFDESLPLAQDWDLWLRVVESGWELATLDTPLVVYQLHEGQRSANRAEMRRWECAVLRKGLARGGPRAAGPTRRRRLAWAHARMGRLLMREGHLARAYQELRRSTDLFAWNPVVWATAARCFVACRTWQGARP